MLEISVFRKDKRQHLLMKKLRCSVSNWPLAGSRVTGKLSQGPTVTECSPLAHSFAPSAVYSAARTGAGAGREAGPRSVPGHTSRVESCSSGNLEPDTEESTGIKHRIIINEFWLGGAALTL